MNNTTAENGRVGLEIVGQLTILGDTRGGTAGGGAVGFRLRPP